MRTMKKNIRKFLDLSTAHLPVEIRGELEELEVDRGNLGSPGIGGCVFYPTNVGGIMWVPDDPEESAEGQEEEVHPALLKIQLYARGLGCDYVLFDRDAEEDEGLESFEEEEKEKPIDEHWHNCHVVWEGETYRHNWSHLGSLADCGPELQPCPDHEGGSPVPTTEVHPIR